MYPFFHHTRRLAAGLGLALGLLALAGCATGGGAARSPAAAPVDVAAVVPTYVAPARIVIGRVRFPDPAGGVAVVDLSPFAAPQGDLSGRVLEARRTDTLETTARLVASGRRAGSILGVYVMDGSPSAGDEVVLLPLGPAVDAATAP